ncbi:transposase, partial [Neisseria meningitidis]|nr:transposase [Neisseria meningitidis]
MQLSLTEKGQYAVAYDLSCKKDCHELHATDP